MFDRGFDGVVWGGFRRSIVGGGSRFRLCFLKFEDIGVIVGVSVIGSGD